MCLLGTFSFMPRFRPAYGASPFPHRDQPQMVVSMSVFLRFTSSCKATLSPMTCRKIQSKCSRQLCCARRSTKPPQPILHRNVMRRDLDGSVAPKVGKLHARPNSQTSHVRRLPGSSVSNLAVRHGCVVLSFSWQSSTAGADQVRMVPYQQPVGSIRVSLWH